MRLSKLIGLVLAGGCVVLLAVSGLLVSGALTTMDTTENVEAMPLDKGTQDLIAAVDSAGMDGYGVISQKPLFNESREPEVSDTADAGVDDPDKDETVVEAEPLDVSVNGIIITPDLRLAIVTDNKTNTRMRVREGMPLEEEMAAWRLDSIEPRKLTFSDGESKESVVEMAVDSEGTPAPTPAARQPERNAQDDGGDGDNNPGSEATRAEQAEEIRRRVAERRAQLRAEAERRRAEQNKEQ